jgi:glycosyltransferase involved in cell wall biosynthesis
MGLMAKRFKPMRIGFLLFHPLKESLGSVRRVFDLATGLKEKGIDSVIITPFGRQTKIRGISIEELPIFSPKIGVGEHVYRVARGLTSSRFFGRFLIRNIRYVSREVNYVRPESLKRLNLDILQIEQEPTSLAVLPLVKELKIPLVLDFHGIWIDELVAQGLITRQNKEYYILQEMVKNAVAQMDAVLVMSEQMKHYIIQEYNMASEKVHIIGMGTRPRVTKLPPRDGPTKIIYAGMLSKEKHTDLFLKSIPYVVKRSSNIKFYITKKGDMIKEALKVAKYFGANVEFFWFDDEEPLFEFMSRCHIGVLTLPNNLSYRINPAAKFFDYISAGLPVVANFIGGWVRVIEEDGVGIVTKDDPKDFAEGLLRLATDRDLALRCSTKCLEVSQNKYSLDKIVTSLLALYMELLGR